MTIKEIKDDMLAISEDIEDLMEKLRNKFDDYERFAEYLAEKIYDEGYNEGYDEGIKRGKET